MTVIHFRLSRRLYCDATKLKSAEIHDVPPERVVLTSHGLDNVSDDFMNLGFEWVQMFLQSLSYPSIHDKRDTTWRAQETNKKKFNIIHYYVRPIQQSPKVPQKEFNKR